MKRKTLLLGIAVIALGFTSCKEVKEGQSVDSVDAYVVYVDSLENVPAADAKTNWQTIDADYQIRISEAEAALENSKDKQKAQERIDASRTKYEALKARMEADMPPPPPPPTSSTSAAPSTKQQLRNALFGQGKVGDDMSFAWVNKDNIHSVYQQFIHTAENNKDAYSREDWDEIKLMYEALDSRKNTVEKEGLSSDDNRKISALKFKFAPMMKVNRMGAKSAEMKDAKN